LIFLTKLLFPSICHTNTRPLGVMSRSSLNLVDLDLWYLMNKEQVEIRIKGLKDRYPQRKLIPFARRDDGDDIACFEVGKENRVQIIHDFASAGYEQRKEYECFWDWFRDAVEEMINEDECDG
jgi:hypothetical protein